MSYRIFFSHTFSDFELVKELVRDAHTLGIEVYAFEHDAQPGTVLAEKIAKSIREADALVALLTPAGSASTYVQQEVGFAISEGKPVLPLVEKGVPPTSLAMLQGREYLALDRANPAATRSALVQYLTKLRDKKHLDEARVLALVAFVGLLLLLNIKA